MEGTREHAELIGHDQPIGPFESGICIYVNNIHQARVNIGW